ncbi:tetratricopeptide repeat protein [Candidatus Electronema sp. TJ]|uniref:tetratricopeptide repeat protein n=1 Tax=Candidatus Electronema sp. TJ TaxID=3401573 RepID=UPI003AA9AE03
MSDTFDSTGGQQSVAQDWNLVAKQVRSCTIPPECLARYEEEFGVTKAALSSFFRILEQEQVPLWEVDSKLRETAGRYKELLCRFEPGASDDPQVQALKRQAQRAVAGGKYDRAEVLLRLAKERDRNADATLKEDLAEQQAALEQRQLSEAASCAEQADLQRLQYHYEESARHLQEAAAALPEERKAERAAYLNAAGHDLCLAARSAEALRCYEQSLSIVRELGGQKQEGALLNSIGQIYQEQGEYEKALDCLEQSLLRCREVGDKEGEGAALSTAATVCRAVGDHANALLRLERSLCLRRELRDRKGEVNELNTIGQIHKQQGDYGEALQCCNQALAVSREIKDKILESRCLNDLSQVCKAQGRLEAALTHAEQSLAVARNISDRRMEGAVLNNIALIYEASWNRPAALNCYEEALVIAQEIGDKAGEAIRSWNTGLFYKDQGDLVKAEQYISRTVELIEQLGAPNLEECLQILENIRARLREKQK